MDLESGRDDISRAILIGTSKYDDPDLPDVPAVSNSLDAMAQVLSDPQLCGWSEDQISVLENPQDASKLAVELRISAEDVTGALLIYFAGHGLVSEAGDLCLATRNTKNRFPDFTGLEYEKVRRVLLMSPARVKLVILDCCHSGRVIQGLSSSTGSEIANVTEVSGVYTLTAADRVAHVPPLEEQSGKCTSFTGVLCAVIRNGVPDGPPMLTLGDLYSELRRGLNGSSLPDPNQRGTDTVALYTFSRNAAYRKAFRLIPSGQKDAFVRALFSQPINELTADSFDSIEDDPGVFLLYKNASGGNQDVVYFGKAERSLRDRLERARRKIEGRQYIDLRDVSFSFLYMQEDLSFVTPEEIAPMGHRGRRPTWNYNGFGNRDPGRARDAAGVRRDHFDALYPIDLSFALHLDGEGSATVDDFLRVLKLKLPYNLRFQLGDPQIKNVPVEIPDSPFSADEAFRRVASAVGEGWQITALAGYVLMYKESRRYPTALRYYVGREVVEATPEFREPPF